MNMVKKVSTLMLRNKSFTYILPLLGGLNTNYKNTSGCFIHDSSQTKYKDKIFLLYRTTAPWFDELDVWLKNIYLYIDNYKITDDYRMYVFDLPEGYEEIYYLFKAGKYSHFDNEYKQYILKFFNNISFDFLLKIKQILYRSEELYIKLEKELSEPKINSIVHIPRTQDISSIPDMNKEVFSISMLEEKIDKEIWE